MSWARLDIARVGNDRVHIRGAPPESREASELIDWLHARAEVTHVTWRKGSGALEVRFQDSDGAPGGFVRCLGDRVFALETPPPAVFSVYMVHQLEGRVRVKFTGTSDDEVMRAARWLTGRPGIVRANPSPASASLLVLFDPQLTTAEGVVASLRTTGPSQWPDTPAPPAGPRWFNTVANTAVLAACASGVLPIPAMAAGVAFTAIPPMRRAARALSHGHISVDLLDVAAIGISIATGQPTTAAFITWLLGIGDVLLEHTADRARAAISSLMDLDAPEAFRLRDGQTEKIPADKLKVGDLIVIDTGRRVAADGVVVSGLALVDEKALTGESEPRERAAGARVLAATVVVEGQVVVRVERTGVDTTAAKIVKILEGAGAKPMTLQRDAERIADRLVLPTFGIAGAAAGLTGMIDRATSVLITDFGTGIRIAVPTSALAAMTVAARHGILVKGAQYLERLHKADVVVFDKTGTLTSGEPTLIDVSPRAGWSRERLLALCAGAERRQSHPIAEAIRARADEEGIAPLEADVGTETYTIGLGLKAMVAGSTVCIGSARWMRQLGVDLGPVADDVQRHLAVEASTLYVCIDGALAGTLAYADRPRLESAAAVAAIKAGGRRRVVLLSGDAKGPVRAVAEAVGVDEARGEMLPEDKANYVREQQQAGHVVAMVGDGINDAPALASADVGISLQGGTDVALETADVVLLEGGLEKLALAFQMGDDAIASVRRGLGLVIVPNAVAITLGALGLINPAIAAAVNNGSTVVAALAALSPILTTRPARRKLGETKR